MKLSVTQDKDEVARHFRYVAIVYAEPKFEQRYAYFRQRYLLCGRYLDKNVEVPKWVKCKFSGTRYNIDTSSSVKSQNEVF